MAKNKANFSYIETLTLDTKPAVDFFALRGSIKSKKKYSDKKADKAAAQYFRERGIKKSGRIEP